MSGNFHWKSILPAQVDDLLPTNPSHLTVAHIDPVSDENVVLSGVSRLLESETFVVLLVIASWTIFLFSTGTVW